MNLAIWTLDSGLDAIPNLAGVDRYTCDIVVVGGGIAGVSVAAELAEAAEVVLVERESQLAYHTTGRSAALYFGSYGHPSTL
ncbi:MAG: FAD-dependent oxidoreductase, partial [Halobacteriales archaeon]|nr:FAD-dependent oxidoreductase [Halobacteriales archaeon]